VYNTQKALMQQTAMHVQDTAIPDVKMITPQLFGDARGFFVESFSAARYHKALGVAPAEWTQDNLSHSDKGVLRGLHFQKAPHAQGKLVSVLRGTVFDVAVDMRPDAPTYGQHVSIILTPPTRGADGAWHWQQFWIPPGFAHGFLALEDNTLFAYKCAYSPYVPDADAGVRYDDPDIGIAWPLEAYDIDSPIVSAKDAAHPPFAVLRAQGDDKRQNV